MNTSFEIQLSDLDRQRFGAVSARANAVSHSDIDGMLRFCGDNQVRFLIARCPTADLSAAQDMERNGFLLMDTLVYYRRSLVNIPPPADLEPIRIRPIETGDEDLVRAVAGECFRDYRGHYHADAKLLREQCDDAYVSWAARSCVSRDVADEVLVAVLDNAVVGFATLRLASPTEGEGVLFGVAPRAQGKGVYRRFMIDAMQWFQSRGAKRMFVSTQITNLAVQHSWVGLGFAPYQAFYTFHKWFQ
jgi:GNAT superfamily N-acetyltransferase